MELREKIEAALTVWLDDEADHFELGEGCTRVEGHFDLGELAETILDIPEIKEALELDAAVTKFVPRSTSV